MEYIETVWKVYIEKQLIDVNDGKLDISDQYYNDWEMSYLP